MGVLDIKDANEQDIGILMAGGSLEHTPTAPTKVAATP
jgi:hypothetical protein